MEFNVSTEFGDVHFKKNESFSGDALSFHVWVGVKGIIEIELGESGEILSSTYRPWSHNLTLMRTMIILADENDINFFNEQRNQAHHARTSGVFQPRVKHR